MPRARGAVMAILRLAAIVIAIEAVFYVLIALYLRSSRREALEERWDARHPLRAGDNAERRTFVRRSMAGYGRTMQARLVWLVVVLPLVAVMAIIYVVNFD